MAKTIFPTPKVVGKTVKMLLAVAKSDSYARNENSYFLAMYPTGSDDMID